jgi:hypothetical protein
MHHDSSRVTLRTALGSKHAGIATLVSDRDQARATGQCEAALIITNLVISELWDTIRRTGLGSQHAGIPALVGDGN